VHNRVQSREELVNRSTVQAFCAQEPMGRLVCEDDTSVGIDRQNRSWTGVDQHLQLCLDIASTLLLPFQLAEVHQGNLPISQQLADEQTRTREASRGQHQTDQCLVRRKIAEDLLRNRTHDSDQDGLPAGQKPSNDHHREQIQEPERYEGFRKEVKRSYRQDAGKGQAQ
jgi:hypothetical protein